MGDVFSFNSLRSHFVKSASRTSIAFLLATSSILGASAAAARPLPPLPERNPARTGWTQQAWKNTKSTAFCLGHTLVHSDITRQYDKRDGFDKPTSGMKNQGGFIKCFGEDAGDVFKALKPLFGVPDP